MDHALPLMPAQDEGQKYKDHHGNAHTDADFFSLSADTIRDKKRMPTVEGKPPVSFLRGRICGGVYREALLWV